MPQPSTHLLRLLCSALVFTAAEAAQEPPADTPAAASIARDLRLWDGPAPGVRPDPGPERIENGRIRNVSVPTLAAYFPAKANGTAIIMVSGGGYVQLANQRVGEEAAKAFLPHGFTVFSLKYRLEPASAQVRADAMADGARAVRLVRSRAGEWNLAADRIGMVGYSAGGNLILNLLVHADPGAPAAPDPIERQSSRPDFAGLLSAWPHQQRAADFRFTASTPPVFLAHCEDDETAPVAFARGLQAQLAQAGVPLHAEFFPTGQHGGFSLGNGLHRDWPERFMPWLESLRPGRR